MYKIRSKFSFYLSTWLVIVGMLLGCGPPGLEPLPPASTVLAFGDSLTLGVGVARAKSYPAILAELTGLNVVNSGVSGETTDLGVSRLRNELDRTQPKLLILAQGGNDILRNRDFKEIKSNLSAMIAIAKRRSIPVVLLGIPKKSLLSNSAKFYKELAQENQLIFDGKLVAKLLRNPAYKSDLIHFNEKGYRIMAESIYKLLAHNGAI